ncbi:hypothetical protein GCM10018785_36420 [Streptomyces longispororuber]|uniref:Integral membrane protein n=1 Tax=Streptomyces longispororuber TaxID=68230 RepID=A0A919DMS3_9ACTN|nr:hypothetical protein [Streptomyces longispororuber]GHE64206.1 hypothetical protein GCM10018785_36420 [Streptomyces longispororuber]
MILEALGSALLGLALAWATVHRLAHRLPARALVLGTGVGGALVGAFITHMALGSGRAPMTLLGALAVSTALLSLLLRPDPRLRRHQAPA